MSIPSDERAHRWMAAQAGRIRKGKGFIYLKRYDSPEPKYGIHEITGLKVQKLGGKIMRVYLDSSVVGLVDSETMDEFLAQVQYVHPEWAGRDWKNMSRQTRELVSTASILPMEWKNPNYLEDFDFMGERVTMVAPHEILDFFN